MSLSEIEKNRKEALKWEPPVKDDRPAQAIAIGVTKGGKWIWGPPDSPILKRRKARAAQ
jgi:hypothetical protein